MLKLKADAQPAGAPGRARSAQIRIDGVSAPKNIKIGLVAGGPATSRRQPETAAGTAGKPAKTAVPSMVERPQAQSEQSPEPQPFAPVQADKGGALAKLGLAAAGLAVASAMLLYFQFGGSVTAEDAQTAALLPDSFAAEVPAGAAAAAGLEGSPASGEEALVARITEGTLAALRSKQAAGSAAPATVDGSALYKMVRSAAAQGQSEAYIDQLVNSAYERGEITVPAGLIGAGGRVDTATLLALFTGN
ncbi:hypothetical protein KUW17_21040 [Leisingera aquaemixtae]|uniref:hypothetical protein n=1 Tax=Leisingera aquaemixtae TaxID=1396826 RepID=UPI001C982865|nr:hypothetical protein [Leisingera aquaemixtae]MBY6069243.1 hypothetical protein [Leisingera aquaemixtae]